ncbi:MAG: hypothetical protein HUJ29_04575 [Gammaproteobacteria bacterium]|nr:hypothetical protein [Gammaproteobacteria bacterium]
MNKVRTIFFALCTMFANGVAADDFNPDKLDTDIDLVTTKGLWENNKEIGRYRLVVKKIGWEHTRSFIYIQWILLDQNQQEAKLIKSLPVDEFNTDDWRFFHSASFSNGEFILNYENRGRGTPQKAILTPGIPGKYKIEIKKENFE